MAGEAPTRAARVSTRAPFIDSRGFLTSDAYRAMEIATALITADRIEAGAITADKIAAGAVTAETFGVDELSAIAANLGTVTAGIIQSADGSSYWNLNTGFFQITVPD